MSDDRENPAGPPPEPPAPPPLPNPAPPPVAAPVPPAAPQPPAASAWSAPPAAHAYAPGYAAAGPKIPKSSWIVAAVLGAVLVVVAILWFTGVIGGRGLSTSALAGTWGPRCPESRTEAVTFTPD